jgi:hypothetical protein
VNLPFRRHARRTPDIGVFDRGKAVNGEDKLAMRV